MSSTSQLALMAPWSHRIGKDLEQTTIEVLNELKIVVTTDNGEMLLYLERTQKMVEVATEKAVVAQVVKRIVCDHPYLTLLVSVAVITFIVCIVVRRYWAGDREQQNYDDQKG